MENVNFNIEYIDGSVNFVRKIKNLSSVKKRVIAPTQTLKVGCFDSEQIDRIMEIQRNLVEQLKTQQRFRWALRAKK